MSKLTLAVLLSFLIVSAVCSVLLSNLVPSARAIGSTSTSTSTTKNPYAPIGGTLIAEPFSGLFSIFAIVMVTLVAAAVVGSQLFPRFKAKI